MLVRELRNLERRVALLEERMEMCMSTESDLQAAIDGIKADVANLATAVAGLLKKISDLQAGQPVTQTQLDALVTEAQAVDTALKSIATS